MTRHEYDLVHGYEESVFEDVWQWLDDNMSETDLEEWEDDEEGFIEWLHDELWTDDAVTGNGSGSYTFNRAEAKENVLAHLDQVEEAFKEFSSAEEFGKMVFAEEWEKIDVTARCFYLGQAVVRAADLFLNGARG